jgi:hypothetical protein
MSRFTERRQTGEATKMKMERLRDGEGEEKRRSRLTTRGSRGVGALFSIVTLGKDQGLKRATNTDGASGAAAWRPY